MITVACESKGAAGAEQWIQKANPQHPTLIDERHLVPELYNTRNVPAIFWIDEAGRMVRANDPVYVTRRNRETGETTVNERYLNAVRDWVAKGPQSIYVQDAKGLETHLYQPTPEDAQAMTFFRLGVYLHQQGHSQDAVPHFKRSHELRPENWNYKRQAWNLGDIEKDYGTTFQQAREDRASQPFYPSLDLPEPPPA